MDTPPPVRATMGRDVDWLRAQLVALAVECPYLKSNPSGCPLHEVRKLEPAAVIDWLDGLDGEEKDFLARYHECCLLNLWERDCVEGRGDRAEVADAGVRPKRARSSPAATLRTRRKKRAGAAQP